jgi:hypothetical protein
MKFLSVLWMTASTRPTRNALVTNLVMGLAWTPYALFTRCPTPVALHNLACLRREFRQSIPIDQSPRRCDELPLRFA